MFYCDYRNGLKMILSQITKPQSKSYHHKILSITFISKYIFPTYFYLISIRPRQKQSVAQKSDPECGVCFSSCCKRYSLGSQKQSRQGFVGYFLLFVPRIHCAVVLTLCTCISLSVGFMPLDVCPRKTPPARAGTVCSCTYIW